MLIDIIQIRKNPGVKYPLDIEFIPDEKILSDRLASFEGNAVFKGWYFYHDDTVHVEGEIISKIIFSCDKCLKPATYVYNAPFYEIFYRESADGSFTYDKDNLVLDEALYSVMLLNLPMSTYCSSACKGLCPVCGTNLNITECACDKNFDVPEYKENSFSSLKDLL